jgi:Flp pilus assembly pilin Flp
MTMHQRRGRVSGSGEAGRDGHGRRWKRDGGQTMSEYLVLSGVVAVTVVGAMTIFVAPAARTFVALFRRLVLFMTSTTW